MTHIKIIEKKYGADKTILEKKYGTHRKSQQDLGLYSVTKYMNIYVVKYMNI